MPRIPPTTLNCVFYLYHSVEDAEAGRDFGGTGFFVVIEADTPGRAFFYAVTNWHVACQDGASVMRVNTVDGKTDIIEFGPEDWAFLPKYDIAVLSFPYVPGRHLITAMPAPEGLARARDIAREKLGPGEDVFMVGRFIDHDGGAINRPSVRFGNISVMPAPVDQPNRGSADAYCIDLHSRSGYSGSPVFVYRTPGFNLEDRLANDISKSQILLAGTNYLALLGIHFAQFPEEWEIAERKKKPVAASSAVPLIQEGKYLKGLSGMTCVLPADAIWEVLTMPELKKQRDESNAALKASLSSTGNAVPEPESAPPATDESPTHREDFTRLLGAAARKPEPKD